MLGTEEDLRDLAAGKPDPMCGSACFCNHRRDYTQHVEKTPVQGGCVTNRKLEEKEWDLKELHVCWKFLRVVGVST